MSFFHFDLVTFIKAAGYLGIFGFVFAESGLFFGFFLPGDSLLFTAGFLASQGFLDIAWLAIGCVVCAIAGDSVGYAFGHRVGPRLFAREDSRWFKRAHLERARAYYEEHGKKTIILARFIPAIRTFAPIVAGIAGMSYRTFVAYNIIGGILWGAGLTLLGYWLGAAIPSIDRYIIPIVLAIIVVSLIPVVVQVVKSRGVNKE